MGGRKASGCTILNVDQSLVARAARTQILRLAGFAVYEARTCEEVIAALDERHADVVLIAGELLGMSGWEACRSLKEEQDSVMVLGIVSSGNKSGLENIVDECVMGPVSADALVAVVRLLLRVRNTEQELRRSNEDLQQFAYVASHDLQEPLRTVNTSAQLLARRFGHLAEPKAQQYLGFIDDGVRRAEALIQDLLAFSRAIRAEYEELRMADLGISFERALVALGDAVRESQANIQCEELPTVHGDEEQLARVFQNLLSNALKFRKNQGEVLVHVGARRSGSEWVISVLDNGTGFDQQYAERVFGLFKRLHGREYPGTGLGLAICKRIVERQGGRIWAESSLGTGSRFSFSLPE